MHPQLRARSSVGSEHLVYTQGVRGSNPFAPTDKSKSPAHRVGLFLYPKPSSSLGGLGYKKQSHICIANMDFCYFKMCRQGYPIPSIKSFNVNPSSLEGFGYKKSFLFAQRIMAFVISKCFARDM